jgi:hypothetical protein
MSLLETPEMVAAATRIDNAANVAIQHKYPMPAEWVAGRAFAALANRIGTEHRGVPRIPDDIDDVAEWIRGSAAAATIEPYLVAAARHAADNGTRRALRAAVDAVPLWINAVCDDLDSAISALVPLLSSAPRSVTGNTTPKQAAEHTALLHAVDTVTLLTMGRNTLGLAAGEEETLSAQWVFYVLDPGPHASLDAVRTLIREVGANAPHRVDQWDRIVNLGAGVARQGQATRRCEHFAQLQYAHGMGTTGGRLDTTYETAGRLIGEAPTVAAVNFS